MALPAAVAVAIATEAIERDGLRLVAGLLAVVLAPIVILVIGAGMLVAALFGGMGPGGGGDLDRLPPPVPVAHLAVMVEVSQETGVPWALLASIASVESGFGVNMGPSSAGAIGYGQFMPASWEHWGGGGDPYDYRDAIPAMAQYLLDHHVLRDVPQAVYGYNHSWDYVALVLRRASVYATLGPDPQAAAVSLGSATPEAQP